MPEWSGGVYLEVSATNLTGCKIHEIQPSLVLLGAAYERAAFGVGEDSNEFVCSAGFDLMLRGKRTSLVLSTTRKQLFHQAARQRVRRWKNAMVLRVFLHEAS